MLAASCAPCSRNIRIVVIIKLMGHPNPAAGMVRLTKESNPFDGIGDGVIKGAVLTVEL
jgi:hypothetical protein